MSTRPIPWTPAIWFRRASSRAGESASPSIETARPFSKPIRSSEGWSGAASGERVIRNMLSSGARHGSSRIPPSYEMCMRLRSIEYGLASVAVTGMLYFCA
jgi:hypothetical protein